MRSFGGKSEGRNITSFIGVSAVGENIGKRSAFAYCEADDTDFSQAE